MADKKIGKYLLYAIGEIFLVAIGILIAFKLNTWNQDVKNQKLEIEYLNRFVQDLDTDSLDLSTVITSAMMNIKLSVDALEKLDVEIDSNYKLDSLFQRALQEVNIETNAVIYKGKSVYLKSFGDRIVRLRFRRSFDHSTVTIGDLTSSGRMDVIRNEVLRAQIQTYYGVMAGHDDYDAGRFGPSVNYYENLIRDLGIPPKSNMSVKEIKAISQKDKRLSIAIQYLMVANSNLANWSSRIGTDISELKGNILAELSKLE